MDSIDICAVCVFHAGLSPNDVFAIIGGLGCGSTAIMMLVAAYCYQQNRAI